MILIPRDDRYDLPWWERGNLSAIPAPPGLTSNYIDPPSKASWDIVTQAVCLTVTTLLVAMRMYTKIKVLKNPGWDDYTSFLAWLGLIILAIVYLEEDRHGNGRHIWDITGYQYVAYAKLNYVVQIVYNPTIFLTKASILLLYLRAFNPVRRTCIILYIVLWANFTFYLAAIIGEALQCLPVEKAWLPLMSGHCIDQRAAQTSSAAINTFSDFVILVVPIANVWGLQLYPKGRVGLILIFGFGAVACIASVIRLWLFAEKQPMIEGAIDETWDFYATNLISIAEITCGIICGCLPAFPAFIRHVSDIKVKIMKSSPNRSQSTFAPSGLNTRRPIPDVLTSPASTDSATSPTYSSVKSLSPTKAGWRDGGRSRHHQWEELDELEYVAGDDQRYAVKELGSGAPQTPPPTFK